LVWATVHSNFGGEKTGDCATTALNVFELFCLAEESTKPEKNNAVVQELISRLTIIHLTPGALREAAKIFTDLKKLKKKPDIRSILVGVTAKHREYTLFTATQTNYTGVEGIKLYK